MYKPDSVLPDESGIPIIYLGKGIAAKALSVYPLQLFYHSGEQPGTFDVDVKCDWSVHDISARKVYPMVESPEPSVRFYHTFSPLSRTVAGRFSFCDTICPCLTQVPFVKWYGALRCPDFPLSGYESDRSITDAGF